MLLGSRRAPGRSAADRPVRRDRPATTEPCAALPARARCAPRRARRPTRARRPLAQAPAHPGRPARGPLRGDRQARTPASLREMERASSASSSDRRDPDDPPGKQAGMKHAPRPNEYRDTWCGQLTAERAGHARPRRRLGPPPARPRRADLHRPARPLGDRAARVPPRDRAGSSPAAHGLRSEDVIIGRRHGVAPRSRERQSEPGHRRDRDGRRQSLSSSPTPTRRRSRWTRGSRWTRACGSSTARSTCAARRCRRRWRCATA